MQRVGFPLLLYLHVIGSIFTYLSCTDICSLGSVEYAAGYLFTLWLHASRTFGSGLLQIIMFHSEPPQRRYQP